MFLGLIWNVVGLFPYLLQFENKTFKFKIVTNCFLCLVMYQIFQKKITFDGKELICFDLSNDRECCDVQ